jgi:hypothetical protein
LTTKRASGNGRIQPIPANGVITPATVGLERADIDGKLAKFYICRILKINRKLAGNLAGSSNCRSKAVILIEEGFFDRITDDRFFRNQGKGCQAG